jgi:hypothetical protein
MTGTIGEALIPFVIGEGDGRPVVSPAAEALYARLGPIAAANDAENDWYALQRCEALARMRQGLDAIVEDSATHAGWTLIADPDAAPASWLQWAAVALYGVTLVPGSSEEEQRATLRELPVQRRGTVEAMIADVAKQLTGGQKVNVLEQPGGDAYAELIVTKTIETPDPAAALAAIRRQKIATIKQVYISTNIWLVAEIEFAYRHRTVAEFESEFVIVSAIEEHGVI